MTHGHYMIQQRKVKSTKIPVSRTVGIKSQALRISLHYDAGTRMTCELLILQPEKITRKWLLIQAPSTQWYDTDTLQEQENMDKSKDGRSCTSYRLSTGWNLGICSGVAVGKNH